jgi:hypothetical protein
MVPVTILFAAFSMAATVVAIFRHKADLERPISHMGIDGMMVITVRRWFYFWSFVASKNTNFLLNFRKNKLEAEFPSLLDYSHWIEITRPGIDVTVTKLNNGDIKKKKKRLREEGEQSGLKKGTRCWPMPSHLRSRCRSASYL